MSHSDSVFAHCDCNTDECDCYTPLTSSSRLVSEEDLIDSLFEACDADKRGRVPVSKILNYIEETTVGSTSDDEHCQMKIAQLKRMLGADPGKCDVELDRETCKDIMRKWIWEIRIKDSIDDLDEELIPQDEVFGTETHKQLNDTSDASSHSFRPFDSLLDLPHTQSKLELKVKKLKKENEWLQAQLKTNEEMNSALDGEVRRFQSESKELGVTKEKLKLVLQEKEYLKMINLSLEGEKKTLEDVLAEKEEKFAAISREYNASKSEIATLKKDHDEQSSNSKVQLQVMASLAEELKQKEDLIFELKEEICKWSSETEEIRSKESHVSLPSLNTSSINHEIRPPRSPMRESCASVMKDDTRESREEPASTSFTILPISPPTPKAPPKSHSICNEFKASAPDLMDDSDLIPICQKERDLFFYTSTPLSSGPLSGDDIVLPPSAQALPEELRARLLEQVRQLSESLANIKVEKEMLEERNHCLATEMKNLEESKQHSENQLLQEIRTIHEQHAAEKEKLMSTLDQLKMTNDALNTELSNVKPLETEDYDAVENGTYANDQLAAEMLQLQKENKLLRMRLDTSIDGNNNIATTSEATQTAGSMDSDAASINCSDWQSSIVTLLGLVAICLLLLITVIMGNADKMQDILSQHISLRHYEPPPF